MPDLLESLREDIDDIDEEIVDLLIRRRSLERKAAMLKDEDGKDLRDRDREDQHIEDLKEYAWAPNFGPRIDMVFRSIFDMSLADQKLHLME